MAPGDKRSISMSLSQWPALLGGSAITLDTEAPHSFRGPFNGWSASQPSVVMRWVDTDLGIAHDAAELDLSCTWELAVDGWPEWGGNQRLRLAEMAALGLSV